MLRYIVYTYIYTLSVCAITTISTVLLQK